MPLCFWASSALFSFILIANENESKPIIVMIHKILYSSKKKLLLKISMFAIQSKPAIIRPEKIVAKLHVEALKDSDSVLFWLVVFLMINGNEHTLIIIIPIPHKRNANWISGVKEYLMDSIIIILVKGTAKEERTKNGFNFFPLIKIPRGKAKANAPTNLSELNEAISGSENPFFLR